MYISQAVIKNYRKISSQGIVVNLKEGLNVLIGENNLGKTTIVEAICLCLNIGDITKSVRISKDDFHDSDLPIEIELTFSNLNQAQQVSFLQALVINQTDIDQSTLKLLFRFSWEHERPSFKILSGDTLIQLRGDELLSYLRCTYLPALRDVNQEFRIGRNNKIGRAVKAKFELDVDDEDKQFKQIFETTNSNALAYTYTNQAGESVQPIRSFESTSNTNISKLSLNGDDNSIRLEFVNTEFDRLLSGLIMKSNINGLDIQRNGLGYNNLIYISTILGDLENRSRTDTHTYNCLIVEEPEAHLHPQLQRLLLSYLKKNFNNVQLILTSHSPTVAAETSIEDLNIISGSSDRSESIPVINTIAEPAYRNLLKQYLDVTRSQLFFARRVIFVEGVTESMLIRAMWDYYFDAEEDKFDKKAVEIVNIDGISFKPYLELVKNVFSKTSVKSAFVTDDDRGTKCEAAVNFKDANKELKPTADIVQIFETAPKSARYRSLENEVTRLKDDGYQVDVFAARKTLEVEIGLATSQNYDLLQTFSDLNITTEMRSEEQKLATAIDLWKKVRNRKTEFSENMLLWLTEEQSEKSFVIPDHIKAAFDFLKEDYGDTDAAATSSN